MRERYSEKFRFVMVDEYQDTNRPQYLLVQQLSAKHRNLCVVGDPDQSIYKWRGADLKNILDFEHDFPEVATVRLERNYRSTQVILDAASAVIAQNKNRKEKRLYTERTGGAKILYYRAGDDLDEAEYIARTARTALHDDAANTVAILYRTNAQSRTLEDALRRSGIEYKIIGGVRFYERKEIKDSLAYLRLILNPQDDVSLRRVINVPARGIGKGVMESLDDVDLPTGDNLPPLLAGLQPVATGNSLWARLVRAVDERLLAPRALASLTAFRDLIVTLTAMAAQESVSIALGKMLDQSGYLQDLREERSEEAESRIENLAELVSAAREYESRTPEPSLAGFVDQLSLLSDVDEEAGARNARVLMMTMHSAKGLEFPIVIIGGLEEGLFPHSRSADDEAELEEERRLCYVGITRAKQRLVLTSAARRRVFGEYHVDRPVPLHRRDSGQPHGRGALDLCLAVSVVVSRSSARRRMERAEAIRKATRRATGVRLRRRRPVGACGNEAGLARQASVVRPGNGAERRAAGRRHEARRPVCLGGAEDAAREVCEAGSRVARSGRGRAALLLNRRNQPTPFERLVTLFAYGPLKRDRNGLGHGLAFRRPYLSIHGDDLRQHFHVHLGNVHVVASRRRQAERGLPHFRGQLRTGVGEAARRLVLFLPPLGPGSLDGGVRTLQGLPGLLRLHDALQRGHVGVLIHLLALRELLVVCLGLLDGLGELANRQRAPLFFADVGNREVLDGAFGAGVEGDG